MKKKNNNSNINAANNIIKRDIVDADSHTNNFINGNDPYGYPNTAINIKRNFCQTEQSSNKLYQIN
jgi:hypothetical protein